MNRELEQSITARNAVDIRAIARMPSGRPGDADALGLMLGHVFDLNRRVRALHENAGDTFRSMPVDAFMAVSRKLGFEVVLDDVYRKDDEDRRLIVHAHRNGMVLVTTTWKGNINASNLHYCCRVAKGSRIRLGGVSTSYIDGRTFAIRFDAKQGLVRHIESMPADHAIARFWKGCCMFDLAFGVDPTASYQERDAVTRDKVREMPAWVRRIVGTTASGN